MTDIGIFLSVDYGENWDTLYFNKGFIPSYIWMSGDTLLAENYLGKMISTNNGKSWITLKHNRAFESNGPALISNKYILKGTVYGIFRAKLTDFPELDIPIVSSINDGCISIYPNPAEDYITIAILNEYERTSITGEIFDMTGNRMISFKTDNSNSQRLDVSSLPPGVYCLRIGKADKLFVKS